MTSVSTPPGDYSRSVDLMFAGAHPGVRRASRCSLNVHLDAEWDLPMSNGSPLASREVIQDTAVPDRCSIRRCSGTKECAVTNGLRALDVCRRCMQELRALWGWQLVTVYN